MNSLFSAENRYDHILSKLQAAVFEYTLWPSGNRDFTYFSTYCEKLFEVSTEVLISGVHPIESFVYPDDRKLFLVDFTRWLSNAEDINWEGRIVATSGKIKWIEAMAKSTKMEDGRIVWVGLFTDNSKKKEIEQSNKENKQRLELALKGSELGIWDYNYQTNVTIINDKWAEIIGYPKAELEEMFSHCEDFIHPDDRSAYTSNIEKHLRKETDFYEVVYRFQLKDQTWRWVMERGQIIDFDAHGNALRTVGTLQDFENRKTQEQIALEAESRYRKLMEALPLGVGIAQDGILVFANEYAAKMMGAASAEQLVGIEIMSLIHPESISIVKDRMKLVLAGNNVPPIEQRYVRLDGKEVIAETFGHLYNYNAKPAIQIIVRNVTQENEAKMAIRKSEMLFTKLFHNSPFGKVMLDETGKVVLINQGFEKMFGYRLEELVGKTLNQFIVPFNLVEEGSDIDSLISSRQEVRIESRRRRKDKSEISVIIQGVPVSLEDKTIGIFGSYVDITEQKKVEEELKVRNIELDNFVYKVSHDLRAPLSSVLGLVNLARLEGNNDSLEDYIKLIGQKVNQLDHFISDVLSHSKNLKMDVKIERIDLIPLIDKTFTDLNYLKGASDIIKKIEVEGTDFYSDPWRIGEILRNLISNAIKYRDHSRADAEIKIIIKIDNQRASLLFSDNGIGINKIYLNKVFEMFYRASEQSDGSGLGLYIVKNAVEKLGGIIKVSSEVEKGTTFELKLPNYTLAANTNLGV